MTHPGKVPQLDNHSTFPEHQHHLPRPEESFVPDARVEDLESTLRGLILKNQELDANNKVWPQNSPPTHIAPPQGPPLPPPIHPPGFMGHPPGLSDWSPHSPENRWPVPPDVPGGFHHPHPPLHPHPHPPPHYPSHHNHNQHHNSNNNHQRHGPPFHHFPPPEPRPPPPPQQFLGDITDVHDFPPLGATPPPPPQRSASSPLQHTPPTEPKRFEGSPRTRYAVHRSHSSIPGYPSQAPPQHQRARSFYHPKEQQDGQGHQQQHYGQGGRYGSHGRGAGGYRKQRQPYQPQQNLEIDYDKISDVALREIHNVDISKEEEERRKEAVELLLRVCNKIMPGSTLIPFGSHVSGLATAGADLDLIMEHEGADPKLSSPESDIPVKLAAEFLKRGFKVALLTKTRVPILKLTSPSETVKELMAMFELTEEDDAERVEMEAFDDEKWPESMSCDIGFTTHLGIKNSQLLKAYTLCDERVRQMVIFIKLWSKKRQINSPYLGTLSSYGYALLVLHFLIHVVQPPVLPNLQLIPPPPEVDQKDLVSPDGFDVWFFNDREELSRLATEKQITTNNMSLGQLLFEFFEYYAWRWDFSHDVVSVRSKSGVLSKEEKNWVAAVQRVGDIQNAYRDRYLFAIEDPFEITHNVARTCNQQGVNSIRNEFKRALHFLKMCRTDEDVNPGNYSAGSGDWETGLLCEVATPETVRNLSKEKRDRDEFVELLKMIKQGLTVGEREKVALPRPPRRGESGSWRQDSGGFEQHQQQHQQYSQQHQNLYQQQQFGRVA